MDFCLKCFSRLAASADLVFMSLLYSNTNLAYICSVLVPFFQAFKQGSIVREEWQGTEENIIS